MKAKYCMFMQKCESLLELISKLMGRCDAKLRGVGNTWHVRALTHVYSVRMIMHEFLKDELCMCIEMHACEVMHVAELRMGTHM